MGTNYYLHLNCCEHCGRPEWKAHIGKQSAGWRFSFRAYGEDCWASPPEGREDLKDFDAWQRLILSPASKVFDEYGDEHEPENFVNAILTSLAEGENRREYQPGKVWKDAKGFPFQVGEFF